MKTNYITSPSEAQGVADARRGYVDAHATDLMQWSELTSESTHVDVPCGTGNMVERFRELGAPGFAYMLDINSSMLEATKRAVPDRAEYIEADAAKIADVIHGPVDSITCLNGLHIYIEDKEQFMTGANRILRPGGRMVFDVSTMGLNHDSRALLDRHDALMREGAHRQGSETHLPPYADQATLDEYAAMAERSGFSLVGQHFVEKVIDFEKFEASTVKIPGRLRSRFPQLDDDARVKLFLESSAQAQEETGISQVLHSRAFYVLEKQPLPKQRISDCRRDVNPLRHVRGDYPTNRVAPEE